jgi:hypothetical protein
MSTSYSFTCSSRARPSLGPSVWGTEMRFSMARVSITWPPKRSLRTPVRMPLRAAYTAAAAPAGPPPTTSTSKGACSANLAASRAAAPVSSLAMTSSMLMRPLAKGSPFR